MIRAGELRTPLVLQSETRTPDGQGGFTKSWASLATLWAKITLSGGGEQREAGQNVQRHQYRVLIRRRSGLTTAMRLARGAQLLNILSIADNSKDPDSLELTCEEVPA